MVLPIVAYGSPILKETSEPVPEQFAGLEMLVGQLWATMRGANGCGLAAVQVGIPLQMFVVDSRSTFEAMDVDERRGYFEGDEGIREVFLNARIIWYSPGQWDEMEGCLSIPGADAVVPRAWSICVVYQQINRQKRERTFSGITARMIQHEFDHTQGILHIDHISEESRKRISPKLRRIHAGKVKSTYPMKFLA